jgi:uncharacterized protein (DUF2141 family)
MQHLILTIILLFSSAVLVHAQENKEGKTVKVTVVNALNNEGTVNFAFYNEENFRRQPLFAKSATIDNGKSTVTFINVPEGEYAILCFHDENKNGQMDFYENGMPKESYGSSNNVMNMGPPEFYSSKFQVTSIDLNLEIKF